MLAKEIIIGKRYRARVSGKLTVVRVDGIREASCFRGGKLTDKTVYDVTNLTTGRRTTFRSAAKFRSEIAY